MLEFSLLEEVISIVDKYTYKFKLIKYKSKEAKQSSLITIECFINVNN